MPDTGTNTQAVDKLIIDGIDGLDGEYATNLVEIIEIGNANSLTSREGHRIKQMTGLRAGELGEAFSAGDSDLIIALAVVILGRLGKEFVEDSLWDAPMGRITFDIADREDAEGDAGPPAVESDADAKPPTGASSGSGALSSKPGSDSASLNDPRVTGVPV